jgi:FkbM family methyltransferase
MLSRIRPMHPLMLAVTHLGVRNTLHLKRQQWTRARGVAPYTLRSKYAAHLLWVRPRTSDAKVFGQIFVERQYACLDHVRDARVIVDCGANVGYSSAYFLTRFPRARVIALEPDADNADACERNLASYGARATVLRSALWSHCTTLHLDLVGGVGSEWGRRVREGGSNVTAIDMLTVLRTAGVDRIDILKIDIEGAEAAVFAGAIPWLRQVSSLVIELHGPACARLVTEALQREQFRLSHSGELTIAQRGLTHAEK